GSVNANTIGSYTLTYSVSDGHGNSSSVSRTVNVVDTTAPSMSLIGAATMTVECHATFSDPGATASDVCAGNLTAQIQRTGSVNTDVVGAYSLIYVVGDAAGNNPWLSGPVSAVVPPAPALVVPWALTVSPGPGATPCGAVVSDAALGSASAQDACAGSRPVTRTGVPSGNVFPVGRRPSPIPLP